MTEEQLAAAQEKWNTLVRSILAKAKKLKPDEVEIPSSPEGVRYFRVARDKDGNFSAPRPRGRKRPHWGPGMNAQKSLTVDTFKKLYGEAFMADVHDAAREGRPLPTELGQQETIQLYIEAMTSATNHLQRNRLQKSKGQRLRAALSRRINAGLTSPLVSSRSCGSGEPLWADLRKLATTRFHVKKPKAAKIPVVPPAGDQPAV